MEKNHDVMKPRYGKQICQSLSTSLCRGSNVCSGWLSFVRALTTHDARRVRGRKV